MQDHAGRKYIRKYRTCASAEEVTAMQEQIMRELEEDYQKSREIRGTLPFTLFYLRKNIDGSSTPNTHRRGR